MKKMSKRFSRVLGLVLVFAMMFSVGSVYAGDGHVALKTYFDSKLDFAMSDTTWAFTEALPANSSLKSDDVIDITIPLVGLSSFIDLSRFDSSVNFDMLKIENSNEEVISTFLPDQLSAIGVGNAIITYTYGELQQTFNVTVEDELDADQISTLQNQALTNIDTRSVSRDSIIQKASAMINCEWKPTQQLIKWGTGTNYFPVNTFQRGIPYTQTVNQCDETSFKSKMSASDFYSPSGVTLGGTYYYQPRYGSDCSGFVSYCWGISRINTSTFYSRALNGTYKLLSGFNQMSPGDAVVRSNDHIMLVGLNYETPPAG